MTLDLSRVGELAVELMEILDGEIESGELPEEATVGEVAVIVEIGEPGATSIRYLCSDARRWVQRGLLAEALRVALPTADEEDEFE